MNEHEIAQQINITVQQIFSVCVDLLCQVFGGTSISKGIWAPKSPEPPLLRYLLGALRKRKNVLPSKK
jgi:hypothetical protein